MLLSLLLEMPVCLRQMELSNMFVYYFTVLAYNNQAFIFRKQWLITASFCIFFK